MKKDYCVHPGELIEAILVSMSKTQRWLAKKMGVNKTIINDIINGKRSVSAKTADKFEQVTGVRAMILLEQQSEYDLFCLDKEKVQQWSCSSEINKETNDECPVIYINKPDTYVVNISKYEKTTCAA